jgi:hypothetical protein
VITLLYWCIREAKSGRIIVSLEEGTQRYKELTMPTLQARRAA